MRKYLLALGALMIITLGTQAQTKKTVVTKTQVHTVNTLPVLENYNDTISYALGLSLAKFYQSQGAKSINTELLGKAVKSVFRKDSVLFTDDQIATLLMDADRKFATEKAAAAKKEGADFLAENKNKPGVVTLPSGLQYKILQKGTGPMPADTSNVKVNYKGTLIDGTVFDNSYKRGQPLDLDVTGVIKGWTEALKLMHVGDIWRLFVPSELAYGDRGAGGTIPPGATLIFEIELLGINH